MSIRIIFSLLLFLAAITSRAQTYSDINYAPGTTVEIQSGASICADNIYINGSWTGSGTICGGPLPVTISVFNYDIKDRRVILSWSTESEINNSGFDIERKALSLVPPVGGSSEWMKIGFVTGNGTSNETKQYSFSDEIPTAGKYEYRLKQIDYNGKYEYFNLQHEVIVSPPKNYVMGQNYPNPGNPKSKVNLEIPVDSYVSIKVYDMLGREVKIIIDGFLKADYYTLEFDGSNLASGVYFYRIYAKSNDLTFTKTLKMNVVK